MDIEKVIIEKGIARALFVTAWADEMEEQGRSFPPQTELMSVAPSTPTVAIKEAWRLTGALENENKMGILPLIYQAAKADGLDMETMPKSQKLEYASDFGHYLAMESLGHGVSWFDNHASFDLKHPYYDHPLAGDPSTLEPGLIFDPR